MSVSKAGRIVTFYSYKGGTGRSMAVANIAWILASNSKRVLVLDWDLEAPGLQRYFRPFLVDRELTSSEGIVDLINDFIREAITPLEEGETLPSDWYLPLTGIDPYVISLNWKFPKGGQLDFIPAGRQGPDYGMRFSAINWQKFYDVLGGGEFIEALKKEMRSRYEYVLVDSRTGVSDSSGICTIQMPDTLAVCFTFNNQSIEGASSITQDVFEQRTSQEYKLSQHSEKSSQSSPDQGPANGFQKSPHKFRVLPIPMRVDQAEQQKLERRKTFARWKFKPFIERIAPGERNAFWGAVEVPYIPYFAYEEILAPFQEDPSDPKSCLAAFTRITSQITNGEVNEFVFLIDPEQKLKVLQEFADIPVPAADALQPTASSVQPTDSVVESLIEKHLRLAETTFRSLGADERVEARRLWMRLVRVPRLREGVENSKVRVNVNDLGRVALPLVEKFAASELLLVDKDESTGQKTVEVSNEELLRSWPRLRGWIEEDRWLLLWRQELQTSKARWEDRGHIQTELLRGRQLAEAMKWHESHREYLNDSEIAFIEASIRDDKARRRRRLIRASAAVLIALLGFLGVYYFSKLSNKIDIADKIATEAQRAIDASNAESKQADQFQLGILLATEAERVSPSAKAAAILRQNLPQLPRKIPTLPQSNNVLRVSITPSGSQVLAVTGRPRGSQSLSEDRVAQLQETLTGKIIGFARFNQGSGNFELSPDGKYLATAVGKEAPYSVGLVDMTTSKQVASISHKGPVYKIAFSPDSRYFATASQDGTAQILDILSSAEMSKPPAVLRHTEVVSAITFSGDSRYIATAGEDYVVHVRPTTNIQAAFKDHNLGSTAFIIALSPHGEYLATIALDNHLVRVWRVDTWEQISPLSHDFSVNAVTFSPDSKFIITAGSGGNIRVWDNAGGFLKNLGFYGDVDRLIFSPDGEYLAAIGNSKVARLWSYNDGRFDEAAYLIQGGNVNDLAFDKAATFIVTAGADDTIRVWDLGVPVSQDLQQNEPCSRLTRNLTIEEWDRYLATYLGAYRRTCPDIR